MKNTIAKNVANATITSLTENPIYPFDDALNDSRLSRVGRTVGVEYHWIKFSYTSTGIIDVDTIGIFGNNFTSDATVKIQANATDVWTSPSIDQALTYSKDDKKSLDLGRDVGVWSYEFSSTQSYQYWRIYIDDSTNPDGYLQMGFVFLDESVTFPAMSINQRFKMDTNSSAYFSTSGQAYGLKRLKYQTISFNYPEVTESEKTTLDAFFHTVDVVVPYMMRVWENSLDVEPPRYVVNVSLPEYPRVEQSGGVLWAVNHEVREVF